MTLVATGEIYINRRYLSRQMAAGYPLLDWRRGQPGEGSIEAKRNGRKQCLPFLQESGIRIDQWLFPKNSLATLATQ